MAPEPVIPRYGADSLDSVVPALLGRRDRTALPAPVREATQAVLLLLDGLGWELLQDHPELVELHALEGGAITTVAPSTTAAALTSLTTGLSPIEHGVLGYRMRVDDSVLNVLRWTVERGRPPDPFRVQRHAPFLGRAVPVVTRSEFANSGFTGAHLRDLPFAGWSSPAVLVERCRGLVADGHPLVYAYYPGVDTVAHEFGLGPPYLPAELGFVDELVGRLRDAVGPDVAICVTADHGQVEVAEWLDLAPLGDLVTGASGEGRFRWLNAARGRAGELAEAATSEFGALAWVRSRSEVLDAGWLGPPAAAGTHRRRLGDVALVPFAPVGFVDPAVPRERQLVGAHGSLTRAEMLVPLLGGRGRSPRG